MDEHLSTVVIALITAISSIVTLWIQKKQDKVIDKIDEQTIFIDKEKKLKQRLIQCEKERETIIQEIMILILDSNLYIIEHNTKEGETIDLSLIQRSERFKSRLNDISTSIKDITKEYELVLDMTNIFQQELAKMQQKN